MVALGVVASVEDEVSVRKVLDNGGRCGYLSQGKTFEQQLNLDGSVSCGVSLCWLLMTCLNQR